MSSHIRHMNESRCKYKYHVTHMQKAAVQVQQLNILQHTTTQCNILQHTATHCNTLQHTASHCNTLQHTATHCNTLQNTAIHCSTLQHTATNCNTAQKITTPCDTNGNTLQIAEAQSSSTCSSTMMELQRTKSC